MTSLFLLNFILIYIIFKSKNRENPFFYSLGIIFVSISILILILIGISYFKIFLIELFLFIGVLIEIITLFVIKRDNKIIVKPLLKINKIDLVIILFLFFVSLLFPMSEFGLNDTSDSSTYVFSAVSLLKNGDIHLNLEYYGSANSERFFKLFPGWIAIAYQTGGLTYIKLFIGLLLFLSGLTIYTFTRDCYGRKISAISVLLIILNPAIILTFKSILSESMALFLIFLSLFLISKKSILGYFSISLLFFLRPEFYLIFFLIIPYIILIEGKKFYPLITIMLSFLLSIVYNSIIFKSEYAFLNNLLVLLMAITFSLLFMLFCLIKKKRLIAIYNFISDKAFLILLIFLIFLIIRAVMYYFDPNYTPDIDWTLANMSIAADFDKIIILRIILFITPLPIFAFMINLKNNKIKLEKDMLFNLIGLAYLFVLFIEPFHEPNIRWWVRRFVPIVIPFLLINWSYALINYKNKSKIFLTTLIISLIYLLMYSSFYFMVVENKNMEKNIISLNESIKENSNIIYINDYSWTRYAQNLFYLYNKNISIYNELNFNLSHRDNGSIVLIGKSENLGIYCSKEPRIINIKTWRLAHKYYSLPDNVEKLEIPIYIC